MDQGAKKKSASASGGTPARPTFYETALAHSTSWFMGPFNLRCVSGGLPLASTSFIEWGDLSELSGPLRLIPSVLSVAKFSGSFSHEDGIIPSLWSFVGFLLFL